MAGLLYLYLSYVKTNKRPGEDRFIHQEPARRARLDPGRIRKSARDLAERSRPHGGRRAEPHRRPARKDRRHSWTPDTLHLEEHRLRGRRRTPALRQRQDELFQERRHQHDVRVSREPRQDHPPWHSAYRRGQSLHRDHGEHRRLRALDRRRYA